MKAMRRINMYRWRLFISSATGFVILVMLVAEDASFARWTNHRHLALSDRTTELYRMDGTRQVSREFKVAYVHLPKSGGSTVERSTLFREKIKETKVHPSSHWTVEELLENSTTRDLEGYLTATTVRNPCDRFLSAFYYLKNDPRSLQVANTTKHFRIDQYDTVDAYVNDYLDKEPIRWSQLQNFFHFTRMEHYVFFKNRTFGIDVVMCQEHWNEGVERLYKRLNSTVPPNIKQHFRKNKNRTTTCDDLKPSTRESINREYAMDFCLFGYGESYAFEDILPTSEQCIGSQLTKEGFAKRHQQCTLRIAQKEEASSTPTKK